MLTLQVMLHPSSILFSFNLLFVNLCLLDYYVVARVIQCMLNSCVSDFEDLQIQLEREKWIVVRGLKTVMRLSSIVRDSDDEALQLW